MSDVKEEEVVNRITDGSWASLLRWPELNFRDEGCRGNELVKENMDDNKEKLSAKFAKMAKTFSIPYVFYAFALCDSNNRDENLNWRNVKQMVPMWFWIREGLKALQELQMLSK